MTRLIDADALLEYFEDNSNGDYTEWFLENIEDAIKDAPTVQREGWVSEPIPLYTAPQQPQSVADALEKAAKHVEAFAIECYSSNATRSDLEVVAQEIRALIEEE